MDKQQVIEKIISEHGSVHLVGIGGISMRGLATMLKAEGISVSGSDRSENAAIQTLRKNGIDVFVGHSADNVKTPSAVVYTAAISEDNPEIKKAKELNIPLITRAEALGTIMDGYKNVICFSGTHGKTTTSSMTAHIAVNLGLQPSAMIGGEIPALGGAYCVGQDNLFIAEACEYCNSFHSFSSSVSVILNVEYDHPDFFENLNSVKASFRKFAENSRDGGTVVANYDDLNTMECLNGINKNIVTFGMTDKANVYPKNIVCKNQYYSFDIIIDGQYYASVSLEIPGEHNVKNTLASAAAMNLIGVKGSDFQKYANTFTGPARRFQKIGQCNGAVVVDDYAHHPSEIRATLQTAMKMNFERVFCVFQPHTYSRTMSLLNEFVSALSIADRLVLAEIYAAREQNKNNDSSKIIADQINGSKYFDNLDAIAQYLKGEVKAGDLVITMGAGDINTVATAIVNV